ncbi:hypothetical protein Mapa_007592 [Marchantia paleacea]|nr:hypothetical protein Mapa_007592 [Marchantia paleacea]
MIASLYHESDSASTQNGMIGSPVFSGHAMIQIPSISHKTYCTHIQPTFSRNEQILLFCFVRITSGIHSLVLFNRYRIQELIFRTVNQSYMIRHISIVSSVLTTHDQVTCFVKDKMITPLALRENRHVTAIGKLKVILAFKPSSEIYITSDPGKVRDFRSALSKCIHCDSERDSVSRSK